MQFFKHQDQIFINVCYKNAKFNSLSSLNITMPQLFNKFIKFYKSMNWNKSTYFLKDLRTFGRNKL